MTDRADLAKALMRAAGAMPPEARRAFRAFVASLPGATPKRRKIHSWKKRKSIARPHGGVERAQPRDPQDPARNEQLDLFK